LYQHRHSSTPKTGRSPVKFSAYSCFKIFHSKECVMFAFLPCQELADPDLWFAEDPADLELAKQYCVDCPIREACLVEALRRAEPWGVWGGEIFHQGEVISQKRPRGRPRKVAVA
jgi:WhiB family redox-sensing transcriptional regulator